MSPQPRGFALLSPERRREVAVQGGRAVAVAGTGHRFTEDEAREAGRKGGLVKRKPTVTTILVRPDLRERAEKILDAAGVKRKPKKVAP